MKQIKKLIIFCNDHPVKVIAILLSLIVVIGWITIFYKNIDLYRLTGPLLLFYLANFLLEFPLVVYLLVMLTEYIGKVWEKIYEWAKNK